MTDKGKTQAEGEGAGRGGSSALREPLVSLLQGTWGGGRGHERGLLKYSYLFPLLNWKGPQS